MHDGRIALVHVVDCAHKVEGPAERLGLARPPVRALLLFGENEGLEGAAGHELGDDETGVA